MNPAQDRSSLGEGKEGPTVPARVGLGRPRPGLGTLRRLLHDADFGSGRGPDPDRAGIVARPVLRGPGGRVHLEGGGGRGAAERRPVPGRRGRRRRDRRRFGRTGPVETDADDRGRDVHRFAFRIVPRRTGTLNIPPVAVRQGRRSGSSRPVRFSVRPLPSGGRPRGFLGGVGPFRVEAEASPRVVRAGGEFEYRLRIIGPAARGSRDAPDLSPFDRVPLGLRITRLPDRGVERSPLRGSIATGSGRPGRARPSCRR